MTYKNTLHLNKRQKTNYKKSYSNINIYYNFSWISFGAVFLCSLFLSFFLNLIGFQHLYFDHISKYVIIILELIIFSIISIFIYRIYNEIPYTKDFQFILDYFGILFFIWLHYYLTGMSSIAIIFQSSLLFDTFFFRLLLCHITVFFLFSSTVFTFFLFFGCYLIKVSTQFKGRILDFVNYTILKNLKKLIAIFFLLSGIFTVTYHAAQMYQELSISNDLIQLGIFNQDLSFYKTLFISSLFLPTIKLFFNKSK
jgi:hypothetical protein